MKKTTYILIGLVIAGAVAVAVMVQLMRYNMFSSIEMKTIVIGDDTATTPLEPFSGIIVRGNREFAPYQSVKRLDNDPEFTLNIVGRDDISEPSVIMNPAWEKYLSLNVKDGVLTVDFDFHGIEPYPVDDSEHDRWSLMVAFSPRPVTINVPSAMLTDIQPLNWVATSVSGLTSPSLKYCWNSSLVFDHCRFGTLTVLSTELVPQESDSDDNDIVETVEYDNIGRCWYGPRQTTFNHCSITEFDINLPIASVNVCGENSAIGLIKWNEIPQKEIEDDQEKSTARLDVAMTGVDRVQWIPIKDNRFELTSSGTVTTTFGKVD